MNYKSVTGKNWLFKQYDENYAKKIYETFHFSEILSKIISIRKIELDQIENFIKMKCFVYLFCVVFLVLFK